MTSSTIKDTSLQPILITGGAGFIGTNLADRFLRDGHSVIVYDNLSRAGVDANLRWLREKHGDKVIPVIADVRERDVLRRVVNRAAAVYHFAAQVAVTNSLIDPVYDFQVNAFGTLTLLEELRVLKNPPPLIFTSTNKVYGSLDDLPISPDTTRYEISSHPHGIDESRSLELHSPYGCSKGAADQYVLDYARSYGLPTLVFRMSCIYGPHQMGTEDQGWIAHFVRSALEGKPITLYGDGMQIRDALYVGDLVEAFLLAWQHMPTLRGQAFNIGGGPQNVTSLIELVKRIEMLHGKPMDVAYAPWRTGDQRYYVSDVRKFGRATGWEPRTPFPVGLTRLYDWLTKSVEREPVHRSK
jgi:CDP-paratose 2-epimerase